MALAISYELKYKVQQAEKLRVMNNKSTFGLALEGLWQLRIKNIEEVRLDNLLMNTGNSSDAQGYSLYQ